MLDIILLLGLIGGIVWIVRIMRADTRASDAAALNEAWRLVLDDPSYLDRRRNEERKRVVDEARKHHREVPAL
jgi:hypothetical protein